MRRAWAVFTAWRRTRPFWGGALLVLGGGWIVRLMSYPLLVAVSGGWNSSAGYILGGAMVLFGLTAWFAPLYGQLVGILGVLAALAAFVGANLGGLFLGTLLGIVGGSMVWSWGEKPVRTRGSRARVA